MIGLKFDNFLDFLSKSEAIKNSYNRFLSLFLWHEVAKKTDFVRKYRDYIYSKKFSNDENDNVKIQDAIVNFINGDTEQNDLYCIYGNLRKKDLL